MGRISDLLLATDINHDVAPVLRAYSRYVHSSSRRTGPTTRESIDASVSLMPQFMLTFRRPFRIRLQHRLGGTVLTTNRVKNIRFIDVFMW